MCFPENGSPPYAPVGTAIREAAGAIVINVQDVGGGARHGRGCCCEVCLDGCTYCYQHVVCRPLAWCILVALALSVALLVLHFYVGII